MRTITVQGSLAFVLVGCILSGLGYVGYRQLAIRGMQAEARLLLSYMQTLQSVYHVEQGQYARFEESYGAALQGRDHCRQPSGAAQLGFIVLGCHDVRSPAPRYAYRSLAGGKIPGFRLEAEAGTDAEGRSVVCFAPDERELWVAEQNKAVTPVQSCW